MKPTLLLSVGSLLLALPVVLHAADAPKPNLVIINIDDLGYGDIGPFGSTLNRTPNLDRMSKEGRKLSTFYAAPVCSPSRAALMTGCYPKRALPIPHVLFPASDIGLAPLEVTVAELLKSAGYTTCIVGKWHLGDQPEFLPIRQGFDEWFGLPYSNDMGPAADGVKSNFGDPLPVESKNPQPLISHNGKVRPGFELKSEPDPKQTTNKPNIILILADDLGYETIGANGGTSYRTPQLDKLAATGVRFTHCFVQPLCTPTRVQLMTGRYNVRKYINFGNMDPQAVTFGNLLKRAGYATCIAGKWQLGRDIELPRKFGFDEYCLWQHTRRPPRYANPGLEINGVQKDYTDGEYGPDLVNDYALNFITRKKDGPFFLYYPMMLTHGPYQPTPDSQDWDPKAQGEQINTDAKHFADMVAYMDKLIGKLVARLDSLGIRDNTLLLFVGDNGTGRGTRSMMGDRLVIGGKGLTTAAGMHVPLIASWPGKIMGGRVCSDLVDSTDFLPTLLQAAGAAPPSGLKLDGRSFLPQLLGAEGQPHDWIYSWYSPRQSADLTVRECAFNHRYKLYRSGEFFDLNRDVEEKQPLTVASLEGEAAAAAKLLRGALDQFTDARPSELDRAFEQANEGKAKGRGEEAVKTRRKDMR